MAIAISHTFVSAKADGGDTSLVQPSNWNAAHSLTGFGTGVETALAVNVGSAGAIVVNGGALGTPSSGTLTNATGLPAAGVVGTAAVLGANTFTALQTITQASANAGIIASTGYSLTGSNATSMIDLAGTWNTSGNPVALKIAMTNTASGSTSKFVSFLAGASGTTEVFSVDKAGNIATSGNTLSITAAIALRAVGNLGTVEVGGSSATTISSVGPASISFAYNGGAVTISQVDRPQDAATVGLTVQSQAAYSGASTNITGGGLTLKSGNGASGSAGNAHGGNVTITPGTGYGTGHNGYIVLNNLPTASTGLPSGAIWNNSGVVTIV